MHKRVQGLPVSSVGFLNACINYNLSDRLRFFSSCKGAFSLARLVLWAQHCKVALFESILRNCVFDIVV